MLYLGNVIGKVGVKVHIEKIQAIIGWPSPKNVTELRGILGIYTYYEKFVKVFSQVVAPLIDLTKKEALCWSKEDECFLSLR